MSSLLVDPKTKDPLFRQIEETHDSLGKCYGTILDAGTGGHSLKWLVTLPNVEKILAVSADLKSGEGKGANELRYLLNEERGDQLIETSWCSSSKDKKIEPSSINTILCDYLLGSLDGFTPYEQDLLFSEMKSLLKPNGILHVVGLNPVYTLLTQSSYMSLTQGQRLVVDVARLRDACILLAGHRPYREFPIHWVTRQLERDGFSLIHQPKQYTVLWKLSNIKIQLDVARRKLDYFQDVHLAGAMRARINNLETKAKVLGQGSGIPYGYDYVLSAQLSPGCNTEQII
eukprot:CAMPEP_0197309064 /NCGR_PEP_ID=MMETSP0891-20130614/7615_1 /TAXON_ID=44058 ORGANISM="Aureoumbra lagunensis, Strain CCMP1510" /NCGR_SAMPLE_ID=MMETSP0891 /ASSEMBLY_ACC=CAM_ASM_000534 /LENGTH=286 /DNA_ID=CAMNT_0042793931 /DNA_START=61 /DNA_END=921 /DNA_ORIENTATION=+